MEQNITVNKAAQTIAFSAVSDKTYPATTTVPLTATATSGLTPTFSVVSGPATVSGATLTLTGTGTVVVSAGQAGNGNYLAAAPVDRSFTVTSSAVYSGTLEAENAVLQGAFVATSQTGYTGAGFADYANATGDYIQWTVTANTAGSAYLKFRYANGGTTNRPLELRVNGAVVSGPGLPFAPSGGWSTWVNQTVTVGLNAGSNTIRLSTIGTHGPNVDHLAYEILQSGTLEAEDAFLSGVTFSNYNAGYTGTGYGNYNNINTDYIEWTVNKANASQVNLKFRYANGYAENRPLKLTVNGTVVASGLAFNPTGSWTTWTTTSGINANLVSGENRIRLTATSVMGVNMDHLSFTSSPSANPVARIASQESPADQAVDQLRVSVFPNPASGRATLAISSPVNTALEIKLVNIMGRVVQMLQKQPEGQSAEMSISVQDLPPGLYSIQVKQGHRCTQTKLVVR